MNGAGRRQRLLAIGLVVAAAGVAVLAIELYAQTRPAEAARVDVAHAPAAAASPAASPRADAAAVAPTSRPGPVLAGNGGAPGEPPAQAHAATPASANLAAHAERETWFARIRDAHEGHESWDDDAIALLQQLGRDAASVSDEGCYMAGCIAQVTFASFEAYSAAIAAFTSTPAYTKWTGAKHITAPERLASGDVVIAVVFERPD